MSNNNPGEEGYRNDIVDTIAQYDLDEDFPDYANEQNKELNQIVSTICVFYHLLNRFVKKCDWLLNLVSILKSIKRG